MEGFFLATNNLKAEVPFDLNTGAYVGQRVPMNQGDRLAIVVNMGDSVAAVASFTLKQHDAASAGTSKVLSIANPYFKKVGVAASAFTKVEPTVAASAYDLSTDFSDAEGVVVFEVLQEDLDVNGNFSHVSIEALDSTAAKLCSIVYVVNKSKYVPGYASAL